MPRESALDAVNQQTGRSAWHRDARATPVGNEDPAAARGKEAVSE